MDNKLQILYFAAQHYNNLGFTFEGLIELADYYCHTGFIPKDEQEVKGED